MDVRRVLNSGVRGSRVSRFDMLDSELEKMVEREDSVSLSSVWAIVVRLGCASQRSFSWRHQG